MKFQEKCVKQWLVVKCSSGGQHLAGMRDDSRVEMLATFSMHISRCERGVKGGLAHSLPLSFSGSENCSNFGHESEQFGLPCALPSLQPQNGARLMCLK